MTKSELNQAISKVSTATGQSKEEVAEKLSNKDSWTWFLVNEAAK